MFVNDGVRRVYLDLIAEHAQKNQLGVVAYCLMTNHVHLVVVPNTERSLGNTFRHAHGRFAQFWNTALHESGHLWQNRFYLDSEWWNRRWTAQEWDRVLHEADEEAVAIRLATYGGRPYGSDSFVRALEIELGRRLERQKGGRPPKRREEAAQAALW